MSSDLNTGGSNNLPALTQLGNPTAAPESSFKEGLCFLWNGRISYIYNQYHSKALSDFEKELYLINPYFYKKYKGDIDSLDIV